MKIVVSDADELKQEVKKYLMQKSIDEESAEYLADLHVNSDKGKQQIADGGIVPLGNCSLLGISPG